MSIFNGSHLRQTRLFSISKYISFRAFNLVLSEYCCTAQAAEASLRTCQDEFDRQAEVVRLMMSEIPTHHKRHVNLLREFVQLQTQFYKECADAMTELDHSFQNNGQIGGGVESSSSGATSFHSMQDSSAHPFNSSSTTGYLSFN